MSYSRKTKDGSRRIFIALLLCSLLGCAAHDGPRGNFFTENTGSTVYGSTDAVILLSLAGSLMGDWQRQSEKEKILAVRESALNQALVGWDRFYEMREIRPAVLFATADHEIRYRADVHELDKNARCAIVTAAREIKKTSEPDSAFAIDVTIKRYSKPHKMCLQDSGKWKYMETADKL